MPKAKDTVVDLFAAALLRTFEEMSRGERESTAARNRKVPDLVLRSTNESRYRWVRLSKHCETTGDTPNAVHARRRKRLWTDGVQCRKGPDGNLYINPEEYNKWIEAAGPGAKVGQS